MSLEDFTKLKVIGKGSYGEVWLATYKHDRKKQYVLKKMNLSRASKRERKSAELEAKLLSKLKHPNIVSYKDSFETGAGYLYIAMQYCEGGDLYNKLKEQKGVALEERQVVEWFIQIAMALQYLHERNILHRDLKTQNIFLTKSKIIKVGDLGIARVLDGSNDMATTLIGTPYYMSPELFSNKAYNHKSDVWALGCCVYEMATLKHAFNAKDMNALVYKILQGKMPLMPKKYSTELVGLIRCMLQQDAAKRPSVNKILRDPYIKRNIAIFLEDTKKSRRPSSSGRSRPSSASSSRSVASSITSAHSSVTPSPSNVPIARLTPPSYPSLLPSQSASSSNTHHSKYIPSSDTPPLLHKDTTPPVINKLDTPPLLCKDTTPPFITKSNTPPLSHKDTTPSILSKSDTPPLLSKDITPPFTRKPTPSSRGNDETDNAPISDYYIPSRDEDKELQTKESNVHRPKLSRKSSKSDVEPLNGKSDDYRHISLSNSGDASENQDTLKEEVFEQHSPPKKGEIQVTPKKKKFLRNHIKNKNESGDDRSEVESISSSRSASKDIFSHPKRVARHRPLPTPPIRVEEDGQLPRKRDEGSSGEYKGEQKSTDSSSRSSSISSSREDGDLEPTPRSLPNLSARERRRQKNPTSLSAESPSAARIRLLPKRHNSEKITQVERNPTEPVRALHPGKKPIRQPSINDDSSSSSEELLPSRDTKEEAKRR